MNGAQKTIHLADHGQDFTRLNVTILKSGHALIDEALPFQTWLWAGKMIHKDTLKVGDHPDMFCTKRGEELGPLRYAITKIEDRVTEAVAS